MKNLILAMLIILGMCSISNAGNICWHFNLGSPIIFGPANQPPHYDDSLQMQWGCPLIDMNYGFGLQYNRPPAQPQFYSPPIQYYNYNQYQWRKQ